MARAPRTYRAPIVVTLAAALIPACGSTTSDDSDDPGSGGDASGGRASSGGRSSGGSGGTSTGGKGSGGAATGGLGGDTSSGGTGALPSCPEDYFFPYVSCVPDVRCVMVTDCTSGEERSFEFKCNDMGSSFTFLSPGSCENPYEYCEGIGNTLCVDEAWLYQGQGGNPPAPCPLELPDEGADCNAGAGFGADRDACGYPCGDAWTVTGCVASADPPFGPGSWVSDGACAAGGAGGD